MSLFRLNESTTASKHGMGEQKDEGVPLTDPACGYWDPMFPLVSLFPKLGWKIIPDFYRNLVSSGEGNSIIFEIWNLREHSSSFPFFPSGSYPVTVDVFTFSFHFGWFCWFLVKDVRWHIEIVGGEGRRKEASGKGEGSSSDICDLVLLPQVHSLGMKS